jgi:phosphoribosylamine---glycine ligase
MKLRVLLLGSGGRESAIAWKITQSPFCGRLFVLPGNPGMLCRAEKVPGLDLEHLEELADWCERSEIDLVIVGPEQPLVNGVVDMFIARGIRVFGPTKAAARLEGSKGWAKDFMQRHSIPTAAYNRVSSLEKGLAVLDKLEYPIVLKADGLAAGKGVILPDSDEEAINTLTAMLEEGRFGAAGNEVVIEERLIGAEMSVFALADGEKAWILASARDYKRRFEKDKGPNTGGMGAISPSPDANPHLLEEIRDTVLQPVIKGMYEEGNPYKGILYLGLILTQQGPQVIEFNCRFGDPETQAVLPLLDEDLLASMWNVASGAKLDGWKILENKKTPEHAVCVVLCSAGYPGEVEKGFVISGIADVEDAIVFHAGTAQIEKHEIISAGGRVLNVVGRAADAENARRKAYAAASKISFEGMCIRKDIAAIDKSGVE